MSKIMRFPIILFAFCCFLTACSTGFFDQVIPIDPPAYDKQMVINCVADDFDSTLKISVTRNIGLLESVPDSLISLHGATVEWLENGQSKFVFTLDSIEPETFSGFNGPRFRFYGATLGHRFITPGNSYEIRVLHFDYPAASAKQIAPQAVKIDSASVRVDTSSFGGFGNGSTTFSLHFTDPAAENFYEIEVLNEDGSPGYFGIYSDDPNVEAGLGYERLLLSDRYFSGKNYTLRIKTDDTYSQAWRVRLRSVTKEYFAFGRAVAASQDAQDNPFASPVQVPSNVENGQGIFGLQAVSEVVLHR